MQTRQAAPEPRPGPPPLDASNAIVVESVLPGGFGTQQDAVEKGAAAGVDADVAGVEVDAGRLLGANGHAGEPQQLVAHSQIHVVG